MDAGARCLVNQTNHLTCCSWWSKWGEQWVQCGWCDMSDCEELAIKGVNPKPLKLSYHQYSSSHREREEFL